MTSAECRSYWHEAHGVRYRRKMRARSGVVGWTAIVVSYPVWLLWDLLTWPVRWQHQRRHGKAAPQP
ncbi:MAG: hypothetical protein Q8O40_06050 [Chloroflexota bacterium]|nr:hypothetical protein [Chloroflexota bacterium]